MSETNSLITLDDVCVDEGIMELIAEKEPFREEDRFDYGRDGYIYKLSDDFVIKIGRENSDEGRPIDYEYEIARELYDNEVSVPEPVGIFDVEFEYKSNSFWVLGKEGFVMQYVDSITPREFAMGYYIDWEKFKEEFIEEVIKCKNLGFMFSDAGIKGRHFLHNILCDRETNKPYLIDFTRWHRI